MTGVGIECGAQRVAVSRAGYGLGARLLRIRTLPDVAERVAHSHLNGLVVGDELQVEAIGRVDIRGVVDDPPQARVQHLLEEQDLWCSCMLDELLNKLAPLIQLFHRFLHALGHGIDQHLFGIEG